MRICPGIVCVLLFCVLTPTEGSCPANANALKMCYEGTRSGTDVYLETSLPSDILVTECSCTVTTFGSGTDAAQVDFIPKQNWESCYYKQIMTFKGATSTYNCDNPSKTLTTFFDMIDNSTATVSLQEGFKSGNTALDTCFQIRAFTNGVILKVNCFKELSMTTATTQETTTTQQVPTTTVTTTTQLPTTTVPTTTQQVPTTTQVPSTTQVPTTTQQVPTTTVPTTTQQVPTTTQGPTTKLIQTTTQVTTTTQQVPTSTVPTTTHQVPTTTQVTSTTQVLTTTLQVPTTTRVPSTTQVPTTTQQVPTTTQVSTTTQQLQTTAQQKITTTQQVPTSTQQEIATTQQEIATTQQEMATTQQEIATTQQEIATTQQDLNTRKTTAIQETGNGGSASEVDGRFLPGEITKPRQDMVVPIGLGVGTFLILFAVIMVFVCNKCSRQRNNESDVENDILVTNSDETPKGLSSPLDPNEGIWTEPSTNTQDGAANVNQENNTKNGVSYENVVPDNVVPDTDNVLSDNDNEVPDNDGDYTFPPPPVNIFTIENN